MGNPDELVLVIPREALVPGEGWLGVRRTDMAEALETVARSGRFVRRGDAEEDPSVGRAELRFYLPARLLEEIC